MKFHKQFKTMNFMLNYSNLEEKIEEKKTKLLFS